MRFASLQGGGASDYASAGKQVADSAIKTFAVQRKYGPDYVGLSKVAMAARTAENIAANEAASRVTTAGIKAAANVKSKALGAEADLESNKQSIKSRMAGILPAIGKIAGSGFKKDPKRPAPQLQVAPVKPDYGEYPGGNVERPEAPGAAEYESISTGSASVDSSVSDSGESSSSVSPVTGDGNLSQEQMEKMVIARGRTPEFARKFAAIGRAESGGNPSIDTVQSGLDPDKSNEYSIGIWQINSNVHMDRLNQRGYTIDDLRDPEKNLDLALDIYDSQGFNAWGAHSNKSYLQYM